MTTFATALTQRGADARVWLEIEGIPYAFGNFEADSTWFSGESYSFLGVKPWFVETDDGPLLPVITGQRADLLRGVVGMGVTKIGLVDYDGSLAGYTANRRRDAWLRVAAGSSTTTVGGSSTTVLNVADASIAVPGSFVTISAQTRRVLAIDTSADTITLSTALSGAPGSGVTVTASDLSASSTATTCTVEPTPADSSGTVSSWPASGVAYMGAEACTFTRSSSTLTLVRGAYRSRRQARTGSHCTIESGKILERCGAAIQYRRSRKRS
jgi:hypothetical protein